MLVTSLHIGASSVSLLIAKKNDIGEIIPIDFLEQPAPLAHDIFGNSSVAPATIERIVAIIQGYQKTLSELDLSTTELTRACATNILTEAVNHETILLRIQVACGIRLSIIDDGEMTRLIYLKTQRRLLDTPALRKGLSLVIHVGPGNTRALMFNNGDIERYTSYRLGTHRTREAVEESHTEGAALLEVIRQHVSGNLEQIRLDYANEPIQSLLVIGYEVQLIASSLGKSGSACSIRTLKLLTQQASLLSDYDIVHRFKLDYHTAEALLPAMQIAISITEILSLNHLYIPHSEYEQGLLHDLLISKSLIGKFEQEVLRATRILAGRYLSDPRHGEHVLRICQTLFEQLQELHQLSPHEFLLLQCAAILHEVGSYISPRLHHKHSLYIILNSEIFGLNRLDIAIVALIARYHRHAMPQADHPHYCDLSMDDRIRVCKLASILRVADALERTHHQRVNQIQVRRDNGKLTLTLPSVKDATVEKLAMQSKSDLFTQTFGLEIEVEVIL